MAANMLKVKTIEGAKARAKPYRLADGDCLYVLVAPSGVKSWQVRYRHDGKQQTATLGKVGDVSLAQARTLAREARERAGMGEHLTQAKRLSRARRVAAASNTFGAIASGWLRREARRNNWSADYAAEATRSIEKHLAPLFGLPVDQITAAITAPLLAKLERSAPAMEAKVWRRLNGVLDRAVDLGAIPSNPLPRRRARKGATKHFPAVTSLPDVGAILRAAAAADPCKGIQRAHLLLVFTAQRVGEVVGAQWAEFDLDAGTWTIPRDRMKKKDEDRPAHVVRLPPMLLAKLVEWKAADGVTSECVCPAPRDVSKPITPEGVEKHYRDALGLSGRHSPHSWRATFKTTCANAGKDRDTSESQLDHLIGDKTESAYDRAERIALRVQLMRWYEEQLHAAQRGAQIIPLTAGVA